MAKSKTSPACSLIYLCLLLLLSRGAVAASKTRVRLGTKGERKKGAHKEAKRDYQIQAALNERLRGAGARPARLRKKHKIAPSKADEAPNFPARAAPKCSNDDDCRVFSNYCGGCNCDALLSADPDPVCNVTKSNCFRDPCGGLYAPCVEGFCTTAECPAYDYKARSQEQCAVIRFTCAESEEYFNIQGCGCGCKPGDSPVAAEPDCPAVPLGSKCTKELVRVTCPGVCEYDNNCLAISAGFGKEVCKLSLPISLPLPKCPRSDKSCDEEYDPVICEGDCPYSNRCHAEAAGQNLDLCVDLEPLPPVEVDTDVEPDCPEADLALLNGCVKEIVPVTCGGCEYPNQCVAGFAGFDETMCKPLCPPPDGICTLQYAPVICEGGCEYSNSCFAGAAGQTSCVPKAPPTVENVIDIPEIDLLPELELDLLPRGQTIPELPQNPANCPLARSESETGCENFLEHDPVICGDSSCIYRNRCAAEEVTRDECEAVVITENAACSTDDECRTYGSDCYPCSCRAVSITQGIPFCDVLDGNCDKESICEGNSAVCNVTTSLCELVEED